MGHLEKIVLVEAVVGLELKKVSMTWDEKTFSEERFLLQETAGLVEGRSQLSRWAFRISAMYVRMYGIVKVFEQLTQDKQSGIVSDEITPDIPKFPPARQVREGAGSADMRKPDRSRVLAFSAINHRSDRRLGRVEELEAYKPSFLASFRHVKSVNSMSWRQAS